MSRKRTPKTISSGLRRGEERLPVPAGFVCKDAFDAMEMSDPDTTTIRAGYRRRSAVKANGACRLQNRSTT